MAKKKMINLIPFWMNKITYLLMIQNLFLNFFLEVKVERNYFFHFFSLILRQFFFSLILLCPYFLENSAFSIFYFLQFFPLTVSSFPFWFFDFCFPHLVLKICIYYFHQLTSQNFSWQKFLLLPSFFLST